MTKIDRKKIGILGFGSFSKFIAPHLAKYFEVYIFVRLGKEFALQGEIDELIKLQNDARKKVHSYKISPGSEEVLSELDYFIFSIPLASLEEACKLYKNKLSEKTILIDVTSVKVKPLKIIQKYFKKNFLLGTHPIFGPQSGKDGLTDLPMVLANVSLPEAEYEKVKSFLSENLKLKVIEKTPEHSLHTDTPLAMTP
jgi:prephenate dehydrogenase